MDKRSAAMAADVTDLQQLPDVIAQQPVPAAATPQQARSAEWVVQGNAHTSQHLRLPPEVAKILGVAKAQDCHLGLSGHEDVPSRIMIDTRGSTRIRHNWKCVRDAIGLQGGDTLSVQRTLSSAEATLRLQLTKVSF